jgi:hypothetical protein
MKPKTSETYQEEAKAMLDGWGMEISRLRASAFLLEAEARAEAVRQLAELQALYDVAFQHYVVMQINRNGRLEDLAQAFEAAAEQVCTAIDQVSREIA